MFYVFAICFGVMLLFHSFDDTLPFDTNIFKKMVDKMVVSISFNVII